MTEEYISIEEKLSKKISGHFASQLGLSPIEQAKVEYGLSILFVDLFKMIVMYGIAFLLHIVGAVFITHLVFISVRFTTKDFMQVIVQFVQYLVCFFLVVLPWITASLGFESTPSFVCSRNSIRWFRNIRKRADDQSSKRTFPIKKNGSYYIVHHNDRLAFYLVTVFVHIFC